MRFVQLIFPMMLMCFNSFTQDYDCVNMAENYWMSENLSIELPGSWCYNDDPKNCEMYGRLYTYEAALEACPEGWRLPRYSEWKRLINFYGKDDLEMGENPAFNLKWGGVRRADQEAYYARGSGTKFWIGKGEPETNDEGNFKTSVIDAWVDNAMLDVSYEEVNAEETGYYVRCVKEE